MSQGDLFLDGRTEEKQGLNYLGNTHGGLLNIGRYWYIFYHRQTNRHSYSRQACAERLERTPDGGFKQAEVTSCGLNGGPLRGKGRYEARIACNLWSKDGVNRYDGKHSRKRLFSQPYFTQSGKDREGDGDQYIANLRDGAVAGFKYFACKDICEICVELRGHAQGFFLVSATPDFEVSTACIPVELNAPEFQELRAACSLPNQVNPVYFKFQGTGSVDFRAFCFMCAPVSA